MPLLGGFRITGVGWAGRNAIYVDFVTPHTGQFFQLYVNRRLAGVTASIHERRVDAQVWDAHLSAAPINLMRVDPAERFTDFGHVLEREPWNRYALQFTIPDGYDGDTHHFQILGASQPNTVPTEEIAQVPYVGPRTYTVDLPAIPTRPLPQPVDPNESSRWQNWLYKVIPCDDAQPAGNRSHPTEITIPALIIPADLVLRPDGNRFGVALSANQLTIQYSVPA